MTEPTVEPSPTPSLPAPPTVAAPDERSNAPLRLLLTLIVLGALAACAWGGWLLWQRLAGEREHAAEQARHIETLSTQLAAVQAQAGETATLQSDLARSLDRNATEISAIQSQLDDSLKLMGRISEHLSGGRRQVQLSSVEQLLLLANDRLLLQRDVSSAIIALESADARLAELSDPQLFAVREALARERTALRAVPVPDLASAALTLASLIERAPQLPLASHAPTQFKSPQARAQAQARENFPSSAWHRFTDSIRTALRSLFTLRREDNARALRMLPPGSEAVVSAVLSLKLEAARVALLRGQTQAMREALRSAAAWIDAEFKAQDPGVLAVRGELERLQGLELAPPLPDISASLVALRARLDARADAAR